MFFCKKKIFNKFLFFSIIFFGVSLFFNGILVSASQVDVAQAPKEFKKPTTDCMMQQRQIIDSLEKIEYNLSSRELER
jgi:hypothetical protein